MVPLPHNVICLRESPFQVTAGAGCLQRLVGTQLWVHHRGALLSRLQRVHYTGQGFIIHLNHLHGVPGQVGIIGHYDGDRLSHVTDFVARQDRMLRRLQRVGVGISSGRDPPQNLLNVRRGDHGHHSGQAAGLQGIDGLYIGMGMGATEHHSVKHVWELYIVDVRALADEQPMVFKSSYGLARIRHFGPPLFFSWMSNPE
jgi:hypothetical protein